MALNAITKLNKYLEVANRNDLTQVAYDYFVKMTPEDKGNAKRSTYKFANEIVAAYPYATRLDEGYSSQSPKGMSEPTKEYLQQYIQKKIGK